MTEQEYKIIAMWEYIFYEQQRAENDYLQYKDFFRIYEYDTIDLLEFILAKNRLDVTNKIMDDLSKILSNHDQICLASIVNLPSTIQNIDFV